MQNLRRRAERDVESAHKFALDKFAAELLPVVDNLERALAAIDSEDEGQKSVAEGIELTLKTFMDVLVRFKIEAIDPAGQPFDAELHQAVSMVPNPDLRAKHGDGRIPKGLHLKWSSGKASDGRGLAGIKTLN